ncbi:MAG TPA: hypothetical protein ENK18_10820 [Deltaproteobacteria bacterium]|nr:hypothetical protein [Deltaproteobacteria bacterium]
MILGSTTWGPSVWLLVGGVLAAERDDLGPNQALEPRTSVRIDIVDPSTETIEWFGVASDPGTLADVPIEVIVYDPGGAELGTFASGSVIAVSSVGLHTLEIQGLDLDLDLIDEPLYDWAIRVLDGTGAPIDGRVWSRSWRLDAGGLGALQATHASFYAVVEGGVVGEQSVIELLTDGLAGNRYAIAASTEGIRDGHGRSRLDDGSWSSPSGHAIYLRPPDPAVISYSVVSPAISSVGIVPQGTCGAVVPGWGPADVTLDSNVTGVAHLICDLDGDGVFDRTHDGDLHRQIDVFAGTTVFEWDGLDNLDQPVGAGSVDCRIELAVGELHFVASDIETSFEGFRLFSVDELGGRIGLDMYFNDAEVQAGAVLMPDTQISLESSGPLGLSSGAYADPALPNVNARAWGAFGASSKGNLALLDTYTWLRHDSAGPFSVALEEVVSDGDADGLPDTAEICVLGTDPALADTDADGLSDALEVGDLPTDPLEADSDGDGIVDGDELPDPLLPVDSDLDGIVDALDPDDDDDGLLTLDEGAVDSDGDGVVDYLDLDSDGDGIADGLDGLGDADGDGIAGFQDADDDGDGVPTDTEGAGDSDGDGVPDYLDPDDDGDTIPTAEEADRDGDLLYDDSDGDGVVDYLDPDDDGDGIDTAIEGGGDSDGDGLPDYLDLDSDGDTIPDADEGIGDSDGDGAPDLQDGDDDGDGIDTLIELGGAAGVPGDPAQPADLTLAPDLDGDGVVDYLDPDDDGDGIDTAIEGIDDVDGDGRSNHQDLDSDGDSLLDADEGPEDVDGDGLGNFVDIDSDGDGFGDAVERFVDSDGDGAGDFVDADDDDDTVLTIDEIDGDSDGDGDVDRLDPDDDGDGIDTATEHADGLIHGEDIDGDGDANWIDLDSDDDGSPDAVEGTGDSDGDGVPDYLDATEDQTIWYRGSGLSTRCATGPGSGTAGALLLVLLAPLVRRRSR